MADIFLSYTQVDRERVEMLARAFRRVAAALAITLTTGVAHLALAQTADLTVLHVNDVYEISPVEGRGGLAQLMTLLERERTRASHHLTTLGGDLISPSLMSGITKGEQMIALANALGFDAAVLGNHEFDFGNEILLQRMRESEFTWLTTNVAGPAGKPLGGQPLLLREVGELKVGIFGLLTPDTSHLSTADEGTTFAPVMDVARASVARLEEQGADLVMAITHLPLSDDRALARGVPGIDVILGGHEHEPTAIYEHGTLILNSGHDAHYLVVADLHIRKYEQRGNTRVDMLPQWRFVSTAGVEPHAGVASIVAGYESKLGEALGTPVGATSTSLDSQRGTVRSRESAIGNLIVDAMREAVGAELGFTNAGGIRGNRTYDAGDVLRRKDVLTELPFGNVTVLLEMTGEDLRAALEHGVSGIEEEAGRFLQVSGMRYAFDPRRPVGDRVLEVSVGGAPLDPRRTYTVATNDYIANGGDGFSMLPATRRVIDASGGTLMASQVMRYVTTRGSVSPAVEGRIIRR
jgi:2',3'-cyclic-nucleotide 2'-phosphodiesterase (5'-nucleotidase family)